MNKMNKPMIVPAALWSQYGANNPEKAVTKNTPPVSGSCAARVFMSGALLMSFILSLSHCIADPATATVVKLAWVMGSDESLRTWTFKCVYRLCVWSCLECDLPTRSQICGYLKKNDLTVATSPFLLLTGSLPVQNRRKAPVP